MVATSSIRYRTRRIKIFSGLCLALILSGGLWYWWRTTPPPFPTATKQMLFNGVTYIRDVRRKPRLQVIHIIKVDLQTPGLRFLVTPGDPTQKLPLRARTTSQFLDEFGVQVAINGDYFLPWHSKAPWNYYPHVNDPVRVEGFAASRGIIYSKGLESSPTLYLSRNNEARIGKSNAQFKKGVYNAISGNRLLVENGEPREVIYSTKSDRLDLHPRTAVGLSRDKRQLILVVIDGRQTGYSEGATMLELRDIIVEYGAHSAIALDGGGSTTLVVEKGKRNSRVLNSPIDNNFPGRERPVANHLGVFASPIANNSQTLDNVRR